jgi:hypothetical protein
MKLIVYYVALATIGDLIAVAIGYLLEQVLPWLSLPVFLFMFFAVLWGAWSLAVRMTEPKIAPAHGAASDQRA